MESTRNELTRAPQAINSFVPMMPPRAAISPAPSPELGSARLPLVLGGGMGIGVSSPALVRAVSNYQLPGRGRGLCLGVASGTAASNVLACRLQLGDNTIRRAFDALAELAPTLEDDLDELHDHYFIPGGKPPSKPYLPVRPFDLKPPRALRVMEIAANFTLVWECKQGHDSPVGINYLQKVELCQVPALYGALLAGAEYVCVGAGNPSAIPGYLRRLACHEPVEQLVHIARASTPRSLVFEPGDFVGAALPELPLPRFIAIVSTFEQAEHLANDEATRPFGFVFEGSAAGGHNAPPAGYQRYLGEPPKWGPKDELELERLATLRQPFWLAGHQGNPAALRRALEVGAAGVQVGTTLAFSSESGMAAPLRKQVLEKIWRKELEVTTEPLMSPAGFPFKVAQLPGTLSAPEVRCEREQHARCDLGHLATPVETKRLVQRQDGTVQEVVEVHMLCPAEPLNTFMHKGGVPLRRKGSICLCNGLMSTAGYAAVRSNGYVEPPVVTIGDRSFADIQEIQRRSRSITYSAAAALEYTLGA